MNTQNTDQIKRVIVESFFDKGVVPSLNDVLVAGGISHSELMKMDQIYALLSSIWNFSREQLDAFFKEIQSNKSLPRSLDTLVNLVAQIDLGSRLDELRRYSEENPGSK